MRQLADRQNTAPLLPTFAAPMLAEVPTFRVVATNTDGCYLVITRQYIYSADYAVFNSWDGRLYNVVLYTPHGVGSYTSADSAEFNAWEYNCGGWRQDYLKRSDIRWFTAADNVFLVDGQIVEGSNLRVEGEA